MISILVLYGGWPGHQPEQFARVFADRYAGEFKVVLSDDLGVLTTRQLAEFDLIVPIWTQGNITAEQGDALDESVRCGLGVVAWHGATDAFTNNSSFRTIIGGSFISHPGDLRRYTVEMENCAAIDTEDISSFEIYSEQYFMHVDPSVDVIATAKFRPDGSPFDNVQMPIAWAK